MDTRKLSTIGVFSAGILSLTVAIAPRFDSQVQYRIGDRAGTAPQWLVPKGAEFRGLEPGYGALKFPAALLGTCLMAGSMHLARKYAAEEPVRRRIANCYQQQQEFTVAAQVAYEMALVQQRYKTLLEAEQVVFEGQVESAYIESIGGIDPNQKALPGQSLDQVNNPGDKVREAEVTPAIADSTPVNSTPADSPSIPGLPNLTWYPSVLVYGAQGSGKTSFADQEIQRRQRAGHRIVVLDPHAAFGAWKGCEVIGGGMNYDAIDEKLKWFSDEVTRRYQKIQSQPNPKFQPLTLVCDEFTNWASRCENSGDFFKTALSDIRKAEMFVLIVSHTRTLPGLGDAKGMAALRDEALLEIELLGQLDPATGKAVPKFEAWVKLPGQDLKERSLIKIPRTDGSTQQPHSGFSLDAARNWLESTWSMPEVEPPTRPTPEPSELPAEPLNQSQDKASEDSGKRFTPMQLTREQAQALINQLKVELNQTQIIERLWSCKKGGSADWKAAYAQFKELMGADSRE